MDSHELAKQYQERATWLLSKPAFQVPGNEERWWFWYIYDKEGFLSAVEALKPGKKQMDGDEYFEFLPKGAPQEFRLRIERKHLCRLVRPAQYDCEPLLSQIEEAQMEA